MAAQKAFTIIKMTAEFFLVSKIKFRIILVLYHSIKVTNLHYKIISHTKFTFHAADQIWLSSISVRYLTITKLYNFFKKTKLFACNRSFISDVKMVDTFVKKPSFVFMLLFLFMRRIFYSCKSTFR